MVYMGTTISAGKASALVVATGMTTELGRIAALIEQQPPEPTPLQRRLHELGKALIAVCLAAVAVIFGLELLRGGSLVETFLLSVSLAVAAVPEGLPAVVTIALALGLERMVKRNALIRTLPSVETLGAVSVICSDKTGTLTRNEMTVREIVAGGERYSVSGAGYAPDGRIVGPDGAPAAPAAAPDLALALTIGARCNNARVAPRHGTTDRSWEVIGDPTEGALLTAALKAGIEVRADSADLVHEIPFDSERKLMSVVVRDSEGKVWMYTKGAPEQVMARCVSERRAGEGDVDRLRFRDVGEVSVM